MSNYNYEVEDEDGAPFNWIHFEGRNAQEVSKMIDYIDSKDWRSRAIVSVELEKPYRKGLEILMNKSDVLFFSKEPHVIILQHVKLYSASAHRILNIVDSIGAGDTFNA
ncbi:962_t:CDS:2 [Entrophospora sp. SA101]|nr:962_t:CDS:2 [Entrophospora sp. SA101]